MSQTTKCFELRTPDGKILADLRLFDLQVVEKDAGNGSSRPEASKNGTYGNGDAMTEAQQRKLFRMLAEKGISGEKALAHLKDRFRVNTLREVTKRDASSMIDQLLKEASSGQPAGSPLG